MSMGAEAGGAIDAQAPLSPYARRNWRRGVQPALAPASAQPTVEPAGQTAAQTAGAAPPASPRTLAAMNEQGAFTLLMVMFVAFVIPNDIALDLAGVKLPMLRLSLILLMVPAILAFLNRQGGRIYVFDLLYFAFVGWTILCVFVNRGAGGVQPAGVFFLEFGITYVAAAGALSSIGRFRASLNLLITLAIVLGLFGVVEAVTQFPFLLNLTRELIGERPIYSFDEVHYRLGMMRARTVFTHPILHGVFCGGLIAFAWYLTRDIASRLARTGLVAVACFAALSGGGFVVLGVQMIAIGIDTVSRGIPNRFRLIAIGLGSFAIFVHFAAESGLYRLVQIATLSGGSSHYRTLIWDHGIDDVMRNPIFGLREETWTRLYWMPVSIDNFWLAQSMRGGLPSIAFLFTGVALMMVRLFRAPRQAIPTQLDGIRRAWTYAMLGILAGGATVYFFDKLQPFLGFMMGFGAAACRLVIDAERAGPAAPAQAAAARPRGAL